MSSINILAILDNGSHVPSGSVYRGKDAKGALKIDYSFDNKLPAIAQHPIKEKLKEVDDKGTVKFVKAGETVKITNELIKENKPISKPPITKEVQK